jgi:type II secretory pathway component PulL
MLSEYVPAQELHDDLPVSRSTQIIDELLSENKENYTIPYSEITQLRVTAWCVT